MISKSLGTSSRKFARLRKHPCGLFAQALYPLIVASADDFGRMQGDAFTVKHSVWSTAEDGEETFEAALVALHAEQLIRRYTVHSETYLEVVDFAAHQSGLHKRTESRFPGISGNVPEFPGDSRLREQKGTEQKGTKQKGTKQKGPPPRPQEFGRISLHRWQLDELIKSLGPHAVDFDLDAWVFALSALADERRIVLDKPEVWPWVQAELKRECQRRGLPVASADTTPTLGKQSTRLLAAIKNIARTEGDA